MNSAREKKKFDDSPFPPSHPLIPVYLSQVLSFISSSRDHILKETRGPSNQAFFQSRLMVLKQKYVQSFVELELQPHSRCKQKVKAT